jgi:tRNA pseudouridine55 synthase
MPPRWHGILNIDKPRDWTSHDVVGKVRRILGQREVGHSGTLDPMATGVLLVCVGQATRVAEYLTAHDKVYRAGISLGITTDTYDLEGKVTANRAVPDLTHEALSAVLERFVGALDQVPPAYSAIKQEGVPAHRLARRGEAVALAPRRVMIHRITLLGYEPPDVSVEVACGPGTYIRSLAHDLGEALGCGAALSSLVRTHSGDFAVEQSVSLEALATAATEGRLAEHLHPLHAALSAMRELPVSEAEALRLRNGQAIGGPAVLDGTLAYAGDGSGQVVAIMVYDAGRQLWQPRKVFV